MPPNLGMVFQEVTGAEEQVVEIQSVCRAFFCAKPLSGHFHKPRQSFSRGDSSNLTDLREKCRCVIPFAQRMPGLLCIEFVRQFPDRLKICPVFSDLGWAPWFKIEIIGATGRYSPHLHAGSIS